MCIKPMRVSGPFPSEIDGTIIHGPHQPVAGVARESKIIRHKRMKPYHVTYGAVGRLFDGPGQQEVDG